MRFLDYNEEYVVKQISWLKCAEKWKSHDLNTNIDNKQNIFWVDDDEKVDGNRLDIKTVQLEKLGENRKIEKRIINKNKNVTEKKIPPINLSTKQWAVR